MAILESLFILLYYYYYYTSKRPENFNDIHHKIATIYTHLNCYIQVRHIYSSQYFDKTPEVTCAGQKRHDQRFRRRVIHKCTHMYLFIKEPVCDTVDDNPMMTTDTIAF